MCLSFFLCSAVAVCIKKFYLFSREWTLLSYSVVLPTAAKRHERLLNMKIRQATPSLSASFDLGSETNKTLGIVFSYNKTLEMILNIAFDMRSVLELWITRNYTLQGNIVVFKSSMFQVR